MEGRYAVLQKVQKETNQSWGSGWESVLERGWAEEKLVGGAGHASFLDQVIRAHVYFVKLGLFRMYIAIKKGKEKKKMDETERKRAEESA